MLRYGAFYKENTFSVFCLTPEQKPKYTNIISPFSSNLWMAVGASFMTVYIILELLQKFKQKITPTDQNTTNSTYFFHVYGIAFAEYNHR